VRSRGVKRDLREERIRLLPRQGFYEMWLAYKEDLQSNEETKQRKPLSFSGFLRCKGFEITSSHKVVSCVCVHHRSMAISVRSLDGVRGTVHKFHGRRNGDCVHHPACQCSCFVCTRNGTGSLYDFMHRTLCPKLPGCRHFQVKCVFEQCRECGWDMRQACCAIEMRRATAAVTVRVLDSERVESAGGYTTTVKLEKVKQTSFGEFLGEAKMQWSAFLRHDFVATWQGSIFHVMFAWMPFGTELWISDYIENFSCFSQIELQLDYYNKTQVAIFIVLVVRHRTSDEQVADCEVFCVSIPTHPACITI